MPLTCFKYTAMTQLDISASHKADDIYKRDGLRKVCKHVNMKPSY